MTKLEQVTKIAMHVRRSAEREVKAKASPGAFRGRPDLGGWCALTSTILWRELIRRGFKANLTWGNGHCFVTYHGHIIDITATQFNTSLPRVTVVRKNSLEARNSSYWQSYARCCTLADYDVNKDWATRHIMYEKDWCSKVTQSVKRVRI